MFFWKKRRRMYEGESLRDPDPIEGKELLLELPIHEVIMKSVIVDDSTYVLQLVRQYTDVYELVISVVSEREDGFYKQQRERVIFPYDGEERIVPFTVNGAEILWDRCDNTFRLPPKALGEDRMQITEWFLADGNTVWVAKAEAESRLSQKCLSYAYPTEDGYLWNKSDQSANPLFWELLDFVIAYEEKDADGADILKIDLHNLLHTYNPSYEVL